jgi:glyoxylase-like metal-dependent hydrolase (beta-lactamase superfamily II)
MDYTLTNQVQWLPNGGWDPRIHIAANGDLVNVFCVVTERFVILVDTLLNPITAGALVDYSLPFLFNRQLLVVNTHADWDHAWGNQLFVGSTARYPAPIIAHVEALARFADPENAESLHKAKDEHPNIFGDVTLTPPTLTFRQELQIDGGDLTLHLMPTPGHTPDHISIFIPEISTLLAGDAAEIPYPSADSAQELPTLRASLRKLAELQPQHALYCHAPPKVGPQLLLDNIAYFDALEAACRAALQRGLDTNAIPDVELPAALECAYADVAPTTGVWEDVSLHSRTERHGEQLREMLEWLEQGES